MEPISNKIAEALYNESETYKSTKEASFVQATNLNERKASLKTLGIKQDGVMVFKSPTTYEIKDEETFFEDFKPVHDQKLKNAVEGLLSRPDSSAVKLVEESVNKRDQRQRNGIKNR